MAQAVQQRGQQQPRSSGGTVDVQLLSLPNQRNINAWDALDNSKDAIIKNAVVSLFQDPISQSYNIAIAKRAGWDSGSDITGTATDLGDMISDDGILSTHSDSGGTTYEAYYNSTLLGTIAGPGDSIQRMQLEGVTNYVINTGSDVYYLKDDTDVVSGTKTFTASFPSGGTTLSSVSSISGLVPGQLLSGTGITSGTRISTITDSTTLIVDTATSASGAGVTIMREAISKVLSPPSGTPKGHIVEMDGFVFMLTSTNGGTIYHSAVDDIQSWPSTNLIQPNIRPDSGVTLFRYKNLVGCFGIESCEFFYNAGNPTGSILERMAQAFIGFGADTFPSKGQSVAYQGDNVFWYSYKSGNRPGIYTMEGLQPKRISNTYLDNILIRTTPHLSFFTYNGQNYLGVFPFSAATGFHGALYHIDALGIWTLVGMPYDMMLSSGGFGKQLRGVRTQTGAGKRYLLDDGNLTGSTPVYTDLGSSYSMSIQTTKMNFGSGNLKSIEYIELIADTQSSGTMTLEYSTDDYANWTTLGTFDLTAHVKRIYFVPAFAGEVAFRLTHSAATPCRIFALKVRPISVSGLGAH